MKKAEAINTFFSGFGLPAYPVNAVPETTKFPWLTYENTLGNYGDSESITVSLWYHTDSEAVLNNKAEQISNAIGLGGVVLHYDDGAIWVKRGKPWMLSTNLEGDSSVKQRQLNIEIEFI